MSSFRDIKRTARRQVHAALHEHAYYIESPQATPVLVTVRVHRQQNMVGEVKSLGYAEDIQLTPKVIFLREQVPNPKRNAIVSLLPGEAYRLAVVHPSDDITTSADVTRMSEAETVGLVVPS